MKPEFDEGQQAWDELQEVPSYLSRFDPREDAHLIVLSYCSACHQWHDEDEGCPQMVEAA